MTYHDPNDERYEGLSLDDAEQQADIDNLQDEVAALVQCLRVVNDTIFAQGAPLGSDNYFLIRKTIVGTLSLLGLL